MKRLTACVILAALMLALTQSARASGIDSLRIAQAVQRDERLYLYLNVLDSAGEPVDGLEYEQAAVSVGSVTLPAESLRFQAPDTEGIAYLFAVDISRSLKDSQFEEIRAALSDCISNLGESDSAAILAFGDDVTVVHEYTHDRDALRSSIASLGATDNTTQLYGGIMQAINVIRRADPSLPDRRAVILISDGLDDNPAGFTESEVLSRLKETHIPFYAVGVSSKINNAEKALTNLGTLMRASGGSVFHTTADQTGQALSTLRAYISSTSLLVADIPHEAADGQSRYIHVTLTRGGISADDGLDLRLLPFNALLPSESSTPVPTPMPSQAGAPSVTTAPTEAAPPTEQPDALPSGGSLMPWILIIPASLVLAVLLMVLIPRMQKKDAPSPAAIPEPPADGTVLLSEECEDELALQIREVRADVERLFSVNIRDTIKIGRLVERNTLVIDDPAVSREHCVLRYEDGRLTLTDLTDKNHTRVNDVKVAAEILLHSGDVLTLGRTQLTLTFDENAHARHPRLSHGTSILIP